MAQEWEAATHVAIRPGRLGTVRVEPSHPDTATHVRRDLHESVVAELRGQVRKLQAEVEALRAQVARVEEERERVAQALKRAIRSRAHWRMRAEKAILGKALPLNGTQQTEEVRPVGRSHYQVELATLESTKREEALGEAQALAHQRGTGVLVGRLRRRGSIWQAELLVPVVARHRR